MKKPSLGKGQDRKKRETVSRDTGFLSYFFLYPMTGKKGKTFLYFPIFSYLKAQKRLASRENGKERSRKGKNGNFPKFSYLSLCKQKIALGVRYE